MLVGSLKASLVFLADLSRAMPIVHNLDFIELAGYGSAQMGGHEQIRVLKDLDLDILDRDVIVARGTVAPAARSSAAQAPERRDPWEI